MTELEFLKSKGLIKEAFTKFTITGDFGEVELTDLLKEYKIKQLRLHGVVFNVADYLYEPCLKGKKKCVNVRMTTIAKKIAKCSCSLINYVQE